MNHKELKFIFASARSLRRGQYGDCGTAIGETLRTFHASVSRQALPDRFAHILDKLDAAESAAQSDDSL